MSTTVRLRRADIEWILSTGPFPFVCNVDEIHWPEHTDAQIVAHFSRRAGASSARIARRLRDASADPIISTISQP